MAALRPDVGGRVLILDRLVDESPDQPVERHPYRFYGLEQLRDSVVAEITRLLNTRRPIAAAVQRVDGTVLSYGMPDHVLSSPQSAVDRRGVARDVKAVIEAFEPRLRSVEVSDLEADARQQRISLVVSGLLVAGEVREQFSFPVMIGPPVDEDDAR